MLGHNSLENLVRTNFEMIQHHGYSKSELEEMPPFEWEIYVSLVGSHVEKENEKIRKLYPHLTS